MNSTVFVTAGEKGAAVTPNASWLHGDFEPSESSMFTERWVNTFRSCESVPPAQIWPRDPATDSDKTVENRRSRWVTPTILDTHLRQYRCAKLSCVIRTVQTTLFFSLIIIMTTTKNVVPSGTLKSVAEIQHRSPVGSDKLDRVTGRRSLKISQYCCDLE